MRLRHLALPLAVSTTLAFLPTLPFDAIHAVHAADAVDPAKVKEARDHYDRGIALSDDGAYEAALVEFERAYEIAPNYKLLYNVGIIKQSLNDFAGALRSFERYLVEGGTDIGDKRRKEVEAYVAKLRQRVANVTIKTNVAGAQVTVDDVVVGKSPLTAPIVVNIGYRRIAASKSGKSATKVLTVAGGDMVDIELTIEGADDRIAPTSSTSATTTASTAPTHDEAPKTHVPYAWWGVAGGLAVAGVVTGVLALGASKSLADARDASTTTRDDLDSKKSKTRLLAVTTDVLAVGALAVGGYALYLTLQPPTKEHASTGVRSIELRIGAGTIALGGAF